MQVAFSFYFVLGKDGKWCLARWCVARTAPPARTIKPVAFRAIANHTAKGRAGWRFDCIQTPAVQKVGGLVKHKTWPIGEMVGVEGVIGSGEKLRQGDQRDGDGGDRGGSRVS